MKKFNKRALSITLATAAVLGGVMAAPSAAFADDGCAPGNYPSLFPYTYDCFPADGSDNYYYSSDGGAKFTDAAFGEPNHEQGGYLPCQSDSNGDYGPCGGWGILWDDDLSLIQVAGRLSDTKANGLAPIVEVHFVWNTGGKFPVTGDRIGRFINTSGNGSTNKESYTWDRYSPYGTPIFDADAMGISIRVCDGQDSNGNDINCGAWHGPFHSNMV